jgi:hypothetical protein
MNLVFNFFLISYFKYFQIWLKGFTGALEQHHKIRKIKSLGSGDEGFSSASPASI